jgi:hypothetical protein
MTPRRDPTKDEIAWILGYVARQSWTGSKAEIERHREVVRRNGALGGRPAKDPAKEAERLQRVRELRQQYAKEEQRLAKAKQLLAK